jgi:acyl-CoA thioester hydrolase
MAIRFSREIQVRFADLDIHRHVNNAAYLTYVETAMIPGFGDIYRKLTDQGMSMLVVSSLCNYKHSIVLTDRVVVEMWVGKIGTTSYLLEYEISNGAGKLFATASVTMVSTDVATGKVIPVPDVIRELA